MPGKTRNVAALIIVGVAVLAAGAPGVAAAVRDLRSAPSSSASSDAASALQLQGALLALCLALAIGIGAYALRRAGHRSAAGAGGGEGGAGGVSAQLAAARAELDDTREAHTVERDTLLRERAALAQRITGLQEAVHGTFVGLSRRTLGLVERQLAFIDDLEENEQDPDRLDTLYQLDHLAACMRRHSENLLVLAGSDQRGPRREHLPLIDVLRTAVGEIEAYQRVHITPGLPEVQLNGFASGDTGHLLAELLENATACSPPESQVELAGRLLPDGRLLLTVRDEGIGIHPPDRLAELNSRLTEPDPGPAPGEALGLGLYVVARLAARHGVRVELRSQATGITAEVTLPARVVVAVPEPATVGLRVVEDRPSAGVGAAAVRGRRDGAEHSRPAEDFGTRATAAAHPGADGGTGQWERVTTVPSASAPATQRMTSVPPAQSETSAQPTVGGLPRRTPKVPVRAAEPGPQQAERRAADPVEVRRLLGGLQQGSREGFRAAAAETAAHPETRP
ncbi:hypothetical protein G5C51_20860 [Streptomyces sp. A7024]|uniref:histidine kinase n=2 Tax=Streptomyces coryli TaxID=1128680 RepID=A0A6G4U247_9ACTN|nr:hypothetical protein [Streptomyces coryli]